MYPPDLPLHSLSTEQRAVFAHDRRWPRSGAYHPALALLVRSGLDRSPLVGALARLAQRHELLRTTFHDGPDGPKAAEHATGRSDLQWTEKLDATDAELSDLARGDVFEPFDLSRGAFRFIVVVGRHSTLLQLTAQHIATDARSNWMLMSQLLRELSGMAEPVAGPIHAGAPRGPERTREPFFAFAEAEAELLRSPRADEIRSQHRERLHGAVVTEIPADHPRPNSSAQLGQTVKVALGAAEVEALREAAQGCGVTVFMFVLGCFEMFLCECTGEPDLVIGCVMSARTSPQMRDVIGFFANVVPIRSAPAPGQTFRDIALRAAVDVRDAVSVVTFPCSRLIEEGILPKSRSGLDGCRVKVNFLGSARPDPFLDALLRMDGSAPVHVHGLDLTVVELPQLGGAQVDLAVHLLHGSDRLIVEFRYDPELFSRATMQRLVEQYADVLRVAPRDVDQVALPVPNRPHTRELAAP